MANVPITIHEGDKEVLDFALYDRNGDPITVDDVTAAVFVAVFGAVVIECSLGDGISTAVVGGVLVVTVSISVAKTETITSTEGAYQMRVTRGSIGPETIAEGRAAGIRKIEGD